MRLLLVVIAALAIAILVTLRTARLDRVSRLDRSVARLTTRVSGEEMFGGRSVSLPDNWATLLALRTATTAQLRKGEICYSCVAPPRWNGKLFVRGSFLVVWVGYRPLANGKALTVDGGRNFIVVPIPKFNRKANQIRSHFSVVFNCVANISRSKFAVDWTRRGGNAAHVRVALANGSRVISAWVRPTKIAPAQPGAAEK